MPADVWMDIQGSQRQTVISESSTNRPASARPVRPVASSRALRAQARMGLSGGGRTPPTAEEVERILLGAGIPAGKVQRSRDLVTDPQYLHRDFYKRLEHSEVGVIPYAGHQYKIRDYNHGPRSAAPMLGEHTYEVLSELLLGFTIGSSIVIFIFILELRMGWIKIIGYREKVVPQETFAINFAWDILFHIGVSLNEDVM